MGGIPIFLIFDPKQIVGTRYPRVPTFNVLSKTVKNIKIFPMKFLSFAFEKILYILPNVCF